MREHGRGCLGGARLSAEIARPQAVSERAVNGAIARGILTADLASGAVKPVSTAAAGQAVLDALAQTAA